MEPYEPNGAGIGFGGGSYSMMPRGRGRGFGGRGRFGGGDRLAYPQARMSGIGGGGGPGRRFGFEPWLGGGGYDGGDEGGYGPMLPPGRGGGRGGYRPGRGFGYQPSSGYDYTSAFAGIGEPYYTDMPRYGYGGEGDNGFPWTKDDYNPNPPPPPPPPGGPTDPTRGSGPDGGSQGGDRDAGRDNGHWSGAWGGIGDWGRSMRDMASDIWSGAYQGDSAYGPGPGTGPSPGAVEQDPGAWSGGYSGDYARGGRARPVRRFEGGGDAGAEDVRGSGRDQRSFSGIGEFLDDPQVREDARALAGMAMVGSPLAIGAHLASGTPLPGNSPGIGGYEGSSGWSGGADVSNGMDDRGGSMNARGGSLRRASNPSSERPGGSPGIGAVQGDGDGRDDKIPALLSDGEHVIPADVVAAFGRGSSAAGHKKLNDLILTKRAGYRKTLGKLPPPKG